jgi:hypothetical protein
LTVNCRIATKVSEEMYCWILSCSFTSTSIFNNYVIQTALILQSSGPYPAVKRPLSCSQTALILQSNGPYPAVERYFCRSIFNNYVIPV